MPILLPYQYVEHRNIIKMAKPIVFLLGPVRGGGDWQADASERIFDIEPDAIVVCPCRWDESHRLSRFFFNLPIEKARGQQLSWERIYLQYAGIGHSSLSEPFYSPGMPESRVRGCILGWLPPESIDKPHPGPEPYAMDTRGELGEWRVKVRLYNARVALGSSGEFYGLSQIQRNYSAEVGYDFPIHKTLTDTVAAACALAA
ncbi:MAG: hypothetical protein KBE09_01410 [Candidatus Pacebacteria bacterium]|nr:hypothetical protein [Candidatus Paceibacterota bacterium]